MAVRTLLRAKLWAAARTIATTSEVTIVKDDPFTAEYVAENMTAKLLQETARLTRQRTIHVLKKFKNQAEAVPGSDSTTRHTTWIARILDDCSDDLPAPTLNETQYMNDEWQWGCKNRIHGCMKWKDANAWTHENRRASGERQEWRCACGAAPDKKEGSVWLQAHRAQGPQLRFGPWPQFHTTVKLAAALAMYQEVRATTAGERATQCTSRSSGAGAQNTGADEHASSAPKHNWVKVDITLEKVQARERYKWRHLPALPEGWHRIGNYKQPEGFSYIHWASQERCDTIEELHEAHRKHGQAEAHPHAGTQRGFGSSTPKPPATPRPPSCPRRGTPKARHRMPSVPVHRRISHQNLPITRS